MYTLDQYNALVAALASGATFVKYSDKEVHYRSLSEMQSLKRDMEIDLGIVKRAGRKRIGVYGKGLCQPRTIAGGLQGGPIAVLNPNYGKYTAVTLFIKTSPDPTVVIDARGVMIYAQYASGPTLTLLTVGSMIPFLAGKSIFWPPTMNDQPCQLMGWNSSTGVLDNSINGGTGFNDGDYITINFQ